jgi:hypothetical protein
MTRIKKLLGGEPAHTVASSTCVLDLYVSLACPCSQIIPYIIRYFIHSLKEAIIFRCFLGYRTVNFLVSVRVFCAYFVLKLYFASINSKIPYVFDMESWIPEGTCSVWRGSNRYRRRSYHDTLVYTYHATIPKSYNFQDIVNLKLYFVPLLFRLLPRARQIVKLRGYNLLKYRMIYGIIWLHGHAIKKVEDFLCEKKVKESSSNHCRSIERASTKKTKWSSKTKVAGTFFPPGTQHHATHKLEVSEQGTKHRESKTARIIKQTRKQQQQQYDNRFVSRAHPRR